LRYGEDVKKYPDIPTCTTEIFATAQKELWYGDEEVSAELLEEILTPIAPPTPSKNPVAAQGILWGMVIVGIFICFVYGLGFFGERKTREMQKDDTKKREK